MLCPSCRVTLVSAAQGQLVRHTRMPFVSSTPRADNNFNLIHCDLWTSPVVSVSGYKYYLVILDDCSHFVWTFPLRVKSDTFSILLNFFAFVSTQFGRTIKPVQCDNGQEFDNASSRAFFATHGVVLRMSCPYTSPQNGKVERTLRTINNMIRSLLFKTSFLAHYWVEGLHTIIYLLNHLSSKMIHAPYPYVALHGVAPSYEHL
jgi:transposase InsO family protein